MGEDRGTRVYVGNLGEKVKKEDLEQEFNKYGKLNSVWVAFNPPGFAFVEFESRNDAEKACDILNGTEVLGSGKIRVEISKGRPNKGGRRDGNRAPSSRFGSGGGGGGRFGGGGGRSGGPGFRRDSGSFRSNSGGGGYGRQDSGFRSSRRDNNFGAGNGNYGNRNFGSRDGNRSFGNNSGGGFRSNGAGNAGRFRSRSPRSRF